jgi:hypothetical protein
MKRAGGRDAIRSFLERNPDGATAGDVAELAAGLGLSQATAYRLIKLFRAGGTVLSLVDRKRGRPQGHIVPGREARRDHPRDDQSILPETDPADGFAAGPRCADELHIGGAQATASPDDRRSP